MYSLIILLLGILPTALLFLLSRMETKSVGPSPLKIMGWTWLLGYTSKCLYLSYAVAHHLPFRPDWISFYIVDLGQFAIIVGTMGLIIGYFGTSILLGNRKVGTRLPRMPRIDPRLIYYPFFGLSVVLLALYFREMGFIEQILSLRFVATKFFVDVYGDRSALAFLSIGGDFLVVFFAYYLAMARKLGWFNIYTASIAFLALTHFLASRRNGILVLIILALIVLSVRNLNRDAMKRIARIGLIVLVLAGVSFASQIRNSASDGRALWQLDISTAIEATFVHAFEGAYFMDPAKTAAIIEVTNSDDDFWLGNSFLGFVIAPIPHVLWPDKPDVRIAPYVAQQLFDFGSRGGVPPGAVGELYLNFGWIGIFAGMMLLGVFLARIWRRHCRAVDQRFSIVRYAFLMIAVIIFLNVEFSAAIVIFIKYFIAIKVVEGYWRWRLQREYLADARRGERHSWTLGAQSAAE